MRTKHRRRTGDEALFLRWAGGKRWLVPQLPTLVGDLDFRAYHEPFLGGGSAFFGLALGKKAFLSDLNEELIHTFLAVRDEPEAVARALARHKNTKEYYYSLRGTECRLSATRAARFIFLNHTSYNGIFRVNSRTGRYNVPFGYREDPLIPTLATLNAASKRLQDAELKHGDFAATIEHVSAGDLVFLDPPYTVAHNNNGFIKYNQKLFSWNDQIRLRDLVGEIRERGAFYILTNAAHPSILELFDTGDICLQTSRRNNIGGTAAGRGSATEYLFTNVGRQR